MFVASLRERPMTRVDSGPQNASQNSLGGLGIWIEDFVRVVSVIAGLTLISVTIWHILKTDRAELANVGQVYVYWFGAGILAFILPRLTKFTLWDKGPSAELQAVKSNVEGISKNVEQNTTIVQRLDSLADEMKQVIGFISKNMATSSANLMTPSHKLLSATELSKLFPRTGVASEQGTASAPLHVPEVEGAAREGQMEVRGLKTHETVTPEVAEGNDVDDPNKNRFGGSSEREGVRLSASVTEAETPGWYRVQLELRPTKAGQPLKGAVMFYLHPTFPKDVVEVQTDDGIARMTLLAWGAFTVGAKTEDGRKVELDLAAAEVDAPYAFKLR
jgi:hypothetical protein